MTKTGNIYKDIFKVVAHPLLAIPYQKLMLSSFEMKCWNERLQPLRFFFFFIFVFSQHFKTLAFCHVWGCNCCSWIKRGAQIKCFNRNLRWPGLDEINFTHGTSDGQVSKKTASISSSLALGLVWAFSVPRASKLEKQFCTYLVEYLYSILNVRNQH